MFHNAFVALFDQVKLCSKIRFFCSYESVVKNIFRSVCSPLFHQSVCWSHLRSLPCLFILFSLTSSCTIKINERKPRSALIWRDSLKNQRLCSVYIHNLCLQWQHWRYNEDLGQVQTWWPSNHCSHWLRPWSFCLLHMTHCDHAT